MSQGLSQKIQRQNYDCLIPLDAFFMLNPNMAMKIRVSFNHIKKKKKKGWKMWACRLQSTPCGMG